MKGLLKFSLKIFLEECVEVRYREAQLKLKWLKTDERILESYSKGE